MANTPKDRSDEQNAADRKGQKQTRKAAFRNKAEAEKSEAKWFNPEPREEASTQLPETPTKPYSNTRLQQGEGHPSALDAGGASDTGDKSRNFETSRFADRLEPGQEANRGLGADPNLTQNRRATSRDVTHLGSAPYQGTGPASGGKTPGAGLEAGEGTPASERDLEREASHQPGASSGMAPGDQLGTREHGHPGRAAKGERPSSTPQSAESPQDMRNRQAREAGADTRGMEKQGTNEGPNAKQTQKRGAGDDTPRH